MSSNTNLKLFVTGATGYIGGTVLSRLLSHPDPDFKKSLEITALVRTEAKGEKLETLGVETVLGSYEDTDVLTNAAHNADIVITMANANELRVQAYTAILKGLRQRFEETGKAPVLIHTSGTAFITDDAQGLHGNHTVYSDLDSDALEAIPLDKFHRDVDTTLIAADKEGYVKVYIVAPSTVFGVSTGVVADLGVQNKHSIQIPISAQIALARKRAGYIGLGRNVWGAVSVRDTADFYIRLFDAIRQNGPESIAHGRDGFYFVEAFEYDQLEVANELGRALAELGVLEKAEPTPLSQDELTTFFGNYWHMFAANSRAKGERSRALGWAPVDGKEAFISGIKSEVEVILKAAQATKE